MGFVFENSSNVFGTLVIFCAITLYMFLAYRYQYWQRRDIKFIKPTYLLGNIGPAVFQKLSIGEQFQRLYQRTTEPFIGIWSLTKPMLMINDPELIRTILIKDFQYFKDRGIYINEEIDPLSGHLFALTGDKWKNFRTKLTPVFTSGKLKGMFSTVIDCGNGLVQAVDEYAIKNKVLEAREIGARYTTNIIASVAFGNEVDCFKDPNTPFRYYGRKAFSLTIWNGFRVFAQFVYPSFLKIFKIKTIDDDVEKFVFTMLNQTLEYREKNKIQRKDLLQLLIQLKNNGRIEENGNSQIEIKDQSSSPNLTLNEMAAQVWVFYAAGFETSSTALSFCLFELSKDQNIQKKAHDEIDEICERNNGNLTYETMAEMKYVDRCIEESLRKYPPLPFLNRECNKAYNISKTNKIIESKTAIIIPIYALHMDPKYFPNPEVFDPDRFLRENKSIDEFPYLAFGDGPRACIGLRLAKLQIKVGLVRLLQKFNFSLAPGMTENVKFNPKIPIMFVDGGINLSVKRRLT